MIRVEIHPYDVAGKPIGGVLSAPFQGYPFDPKMKLLTVPKKDEGECFVFDNTLYATLGVEAVHGIVRPVDGPDGLRHNIINGRKTFIKHILAPVTCIQDNSHSFLPFIFNDEFLKLIKDIPKPSIMDIMVVEFRIVDKEEIEGKNSTYSNIVVDGIEMSIRHTCGHPHYGYQIYVYVEDPNDPKHAEFILDKLLKPVFKKYAIGLNACNEQDLSNYIITYVLERFMVGDDHKSFDALINVLSERCHDAVEWFSYIDRYGDADRVFKRCMEHLTIIAMRYFHE